MNNVDDVSIPYDNHFIEKTLIINTTKSGSNNFFYRAKNLLDVDIIQFYTNKKYNETNTNKTQNLLKVIFCF